MLPARRRLFGAIWWPMTTGKLRQQGGPLSTSASACAACSSVADAHSGASSAAATLLLRLEGRDGDSCQGIAGSMSSTGRRVAANGWHEWHKAAWHPQPASSAAAATYQQQGTALQARLAWPQQQQQQQQQQRAMELSVPSASLHLTALGEPWLRCMQHPCDLRPAQAWRRRRLRFM